jgi:hypothetical protein
MRTPIINEDMTDRSDTYQGTMNMVIIHNPNIKPLSQNCPHNKIKVTSKYTIRSNDDSGKELLLRWCAGK